MTTTTAKHMAGQYRASSLREIQHSATLFAEILRREAREATRVEQTSDTGTMTLSEGTKLARALNCDSRKFEALAAAIEAVLDMQA